MHSPIALTSDRYTAGVSPAMGGALLWFGMRQEPQVDFVRATPARALHDGNARLASSYPLVPYSNRIGDGRFEFDGAPVTLRRNTDFSEHPIHGVGFQRPWSVESSSEPPVETATKSSDAGKLVIMLAHDARQHDDPDWPWSFSARQAFVVDDQGLSITIGITNRDTQPMPAGIGLHPFFPKSSSTRLRFAASAVWKSSARMLPESLVAVSKPFDFGERRPVADLDVDNCFAGWDGSAEIEWPDKRWGLRIAAGAVFAHLVVFTSPLRDAIAVEPVSHVNNALNIARDRDDTGLVRLLPGQTLEGTVRLTPFEL